MRVYRSLSDCLTGASSTPRFSRMLFHDGDAAFGMSGLVRGHFRTLRRANPLLLLCIA